MRREEVWRAGGRAIRERCLVLVLVLMLTLELVGVEGEGRERYGRALGDLVHAWLAVITRARG